MTTEKTNQGTTNQPAIALNDLLTPHQISLLVALTQSTAKALEQPDTSRRKERYLERVDELSEAHSTQSLLTLLRAFLTDIAATLTVECYEVQFNFYDCDDEHCEQFTEALKEAFPTGILYLQRDGATRTDNGTCHHYWHVFIPAADGAPSQETLDELVELPGNIEEPCWKPCFNEYQGEILTGVVAKGWELLP